ncbi:MMB_0454 family protein [Metamycoplasma equirhinis]|uniref:Asp23/Gls24 family envelope stress response protein n=1 Tax=Metamycoplasma equirhinis TaxID=92402 RepID=A0ABZ0P9M2_9BACT|nr:hypothetical protein [Metamycoplasma equirhinis]WPB53717.1 hypothetical protein R9B83_01860 [Metamycoplasma equirhinis]BDX52727.1 hypothetical protein JPM7_3340 [Metamycoplasma equirhinis]
MNYIFVNTKMNFTFQVDIETIKKSINQIFENDDNEIKINNLQINPNMQHSNIEINLTYQIKSLNNFAFETKKILFLIEQKINSLINTKPTNINLVFKGVY